MPIFNLFLRFHISIHVMIACFCVGIPPALRQLSSFTCRLAIPKASSMGKCLFLASLGKKRRVQDDRNRKVDEKAKESSNNSSSDERGEWARVLNFFGSKDDSDDRMWFKSFAFNLRYWSFFFGVWIHAVKGLVAMLFWTCMYILKMSKSHLKVKFRVI